MIEIRKFKVTSVEELINYMLDEICPSSKVKKAIEPAKEVSANYQLTPQYFVQKIAEKKGWKYEKTLGWLDSIAELNESAAFSIVLKEIALELDQKYEGHINDSEEIYIISTLDGRIHKVDKKAIKNYRNFAAFRTMEDAKLAYNILKEPIKSMFNARFK